LIWKGSIKAKHKEFHTTLQNLAGFTFVELHALMWAKHNDIHTKLQNLNVCCKCKTSLAKFVWAKHNEIWIALQNLA
jgi:hypothetical protein